MPRPRSGSVRFAALAAALLLCSVAILSASLTRPQDPLVPDRPSDRILSPRYRQFCASCHGLDGQGFGPAAYDQQRGEFVGELKEHRPADLTCPGIGLTVEEGLEQVVRGGISCLTHGQVMPAFPNLTEEQFTEIAEQIRSFTHPHRNHGGQGHP